MMQYLEASLLLYACFLNKLGETSCESYIFLEMGTYVTDLKGKVHLCEAPEGVLLCSACVAVPVFNEHLCIDPHVALKCTWITLWLKLLAAWTHSLLDDSPCYVVIWGLLNVMKHCINLNTLPCTVLGLNVWKKASAREILMQAVSQSRRFRAQTELEFACSLTLSRNQALRQQLCDWLWQASKSCVCWISKSNNHTWRKTPWRQTSKMYALCHTSVLNSLKVHKGNDLSSWIVWRPRGMSPPAEEEESTKKEGGVQ